jgi:hypothetical protein
MAGHRHGQARRDKARADRMRARIAAAPDEFQAMGHAFDWLRMELQHLDRCGKGTARTQKRPGEAADVAGQVMRELVAHAESIIRSSDSL